MEAKIEAPEPRTSGASFFLPGNHVGNQHIASQRAHVTGSNSVVYRVAGVGETDGEPGVMGSLSPLVEHWFCAA